LRAECQRPEPPAEFVLGLRAGVGNPQDIGKLIAKEIVLWWQSAELERGNQQNSEILFPPFYFERLPV
jgi:replicative superfamily II helicase